MIKLTQNPVDSVMAHKLATKALYMCTYVRKYFDY